MTPDTRMELNWLSERAVYADTHSDLQAVVLKLIDLLRLDEAHS